MPDDDADRQQTKDALAKLGRGIERVFESGVPQQIIQQVGNLATSFVQASAQQPLYAGITGVVVANGLEKFRLVTDTQAKVMVGASAAYVATDLAAKVGGFSSKSQSNSMVFDVPDVQAPRLPPRPPVQPSEIIIPRFPRRGGRPSPSPQPRPLEDPSKQTDPSFQNEPLFFQEEFEDPASSPQGVDPGLVAGAAGVAIGAGVAAAGRSGGARGGPERKIISPIAGIR